MEVSNKFEKSEIEAHYCPHHGKYFPRRIELTGNLTRCPECEKVRLQKEEKEKKDRKAREEQLKIERIFSRVSIPKRFKKENFETYIADSDKKKYVLKVLKEFATNFDFHLQNGTNLILSGYVGTGKGHLAISIAKHVAAKGYSAFFTTLPEMIMMLRASWNNPSAPSQIETLKMLTSTSLLIIDDVGVGFNTESERNQLYEVINRRYLDLMPIIFTTNLDKFNFENIIGNRNFSRIRQEGKWLVFDWEDFRAAKFHLRLASKDPEQIKNFN
jgi:DNA replication protein DnaC